MIAAYLTPVLAYGTVALHALFLYALAAFIARRGWGRGTISWIGRRATLLGFAVSFAAIFGSLLYSQVIGYPPCDLCWWQRIALYPTAAIFLTALYKRRGDAYDYVLPLALVAGILALYHTYIQLGGTSSVLPCTAFGGACTRVYVLALGYVTIPTMSLTIALWLILLAYIKRYHDKNPYA